METFAIRLPDHLQFTDDEFYEFCQANPELKLERNAKQEIILMALTGGRTGAKNMALSAQLWNWNYQTKLGVTFDSSTGFHLPNKAVRSPDAAWVASQRWQALTPEQQRKFPPLCPDFVVELKSESDSLANIQEKMQEWLENGCRLAWLENGCRLAWLLDPAEGKAYVYRPGQAVEEVNDFSQRLSGESVLPGFELNLSLLV